MGSREEMVVLQQNLRQNNEEKRNLEQQIAEYELEKLELKEMISGDEETEFKNDTVSKKEGVVQEASTGENQLVVESEVRLQELDNECNLLRNVLGQVGEAINNVSDLSHISDSIENLPKKIQLLASNMISSKKYCDELSMKMHMVMEEKSCVDFSSQVDEMEKSSEVRILEENVNQMKKEMAQLIGDKEKVQHIVREEYDDILSNLQSDLAASMERFKCLQEENFSLRNQLDVFTNVNKKNKPKADIPSSPISSAASPVSVTATQQLVRDSEKIEQKEGFVSKSEFSKLKALCRKYKNDLLTTKDELKLKDQQNSTLTEKIDALNENREENDRSMQQNQHLREKITALAEEKDAIIESLKIRNETEIDQMKEMYQKSMNQLSLDIRAKDDVISQCQSELSTLKKLNDDRDSTPEGDLSTLDRNDLLKRADSMMRQINTLQAEKLSCLSQPRSHREEITEFVQQRDQMVIMW